MRKLLVNTFITLDGVMQAPGGPEEDPTGGFKHGGWSVTYWDEMMGQIMGETMAKPFELLLGRKTYEIFAAHWPHSKEPGADQLNGAKKHIVSRTLDRVDWNNSTLIKNDVVQAINALKEQDLPELQVHGSGNLIQTLLKHDLIDVFRLWVFPVVIGKGKKLFAGGTSPSNLKLIESKTFSTGVIMSVYEPGGELKLGSFTLDKPTEVELERRRRMAKEA